MMNLPSVWSANQPRHRVLILRHGTRRVSTTVPESLEATLTFALTRFPSLRPPLHITRDIAEAGGAVEISEEVWKTELIDIDGILILDVHETGAREMSVEKDDSNASDPLPALPAVPEAVTATMEARANEEYPFVAPDTSEAAATLQQAGTVPESPPVEPDPKAPPPSPPQRTAELDPPSRPRSRIIMVVTTMIDGESHSHRFDVAPDVTFFTLRKRIARIYDVGPGKLASVSTTLYCGNYLDQDAKFGELCVADEGSEDDPMELQVFPRNSHDIRSELEVEVARAAGIRLHRDELSRLLKPLPLTDPYIP